MVSVSKASLPVAIKAWSMPTSPNSLTITAVRAKAGSRRTRPINVVLPLPRKPVTTDTGHAGPARSARVWSFDAGSAPVGMVLVAGWIVGR